jgi:tetratricopeptide (TPR) repeat protein
MIRSVRWLFPIAIAGLACAATALAQGGGKPLAGGSASASVSLAPTFMLPPEQVRPENPVTADAKATAETLFLRGQKLHEGGNFEQACPLFEESLKLDFGIGTLLFLSDCQEQLGKTASAWAGFREAATLARTKGQAEREKIAQGRAAALLPKLATLRIQVADANKTIGISIKRNGVSVGEPTWGEALPVDPGTQKLEASAPGYETWTGVVEIPVGPGQSEAEVPALKKGRVVEPVGPAGGGGIDGDAMRIAGLTVGAAGLAGLVLGAGFGIDAIKTYDEAIATCENEDPTQCTNAGVRLQEDASRSALISTVAISVGAAAVGGGLILYFLSPKTPSEAPAKAAELPKIGAWADQHGAFFFVGGTL